MYLYIELDYPEFPEQNKREKSENAKLKKTHAQTNNDKYRVAAHKMNLNRKLDMDILKMDMLKRLNYIDAYLLILCIVLLGINISIWNQCLKCNYCTY